MTGSEWFSSAPGGLNRYFTELYSALARRPDVGVAAAAFGEPPIGARTWGPTGGSTLRRARVAFLDRADLARDAVLDRHFGLYGPSAFGRSGHSPLVVHFHGPWSAESRAAGENKITVYTKYLVERIRYAGADTLVVLSKQFRDILIADYHISENRIQVIPPGVDTSRFSLVDSGAKTDHKSAETRIVLCVRRLERRMGIDVLLRAWPTVVAVHPNARLAIVGTGAAERELRELAGGSNSISFLGPVGEARLTRLHCVAELSVVPSRTLEGFGLAALESLAAGRPPIVTDCGGLPETVRALDDTLIVPSGDADALAARIVAALDGARPTSRQCRAHAETFAWDTVAQRHLELYQALAS
ncbi:glycosyltransferase family 4 protein [Nocardia sp. NPDC059180]|uniref:glycosyltransferase family 4 protein n=1 Tax=Nocardia sp. NPDC059180 TaxID=3346761 RepID=UPI0036BDACAD